jgi:hypothetical protein
MTSIRHWALVAGFTCGAAFWLIACGGDDETAAPDAKESAEARLDSLREKALSELGPEHRAHFEDTENGEIRYSGQTESGEPFIAQMGGEIDVPEGFFDEVPLYPESVPISMMDVGEGMAMVTVETADVSQDVYEYYKAQLQDSGWVVENDITVFGGRILRAIRNGRRATLHIQEAEAGTRVGFILSDEG